MTLACAHCSFSTEHASEMIAHMSNTGHGVPPAALAELRAGGDMYVFLGATLGEIASKVDADDVVEMAEKVDADDPDLPDEVREFIDRADDAHEQRAMANLPSEEQIATILFARALAAIFCADPTAEPIARTAAQRKEFLRRFRAAMVTLDRVLDTEGLSPANPETFARALSVAFEHAFPDSESHMAESFDRALAEVRAEIARRNRRSGKECRRPS